MRNLKFDSSGFEDLAWWVEKDRKKALKIIKLIKEIQKNPFEGIGKPEPLKHDLSGARIEDSPVVVRRRSARSRCVEKNRSRTSFSLSSFR